MDSGYSPRNRIELHRELCRLPSQQFDALVILIHSPDGLIAGNTAPQMDRVNQLLAWAEGSTGRGTDEIWEALAQLQQGGVASQGQAFPNFQPYLQAIITQYEKWWEHYTLTDVEGKVKPPKLEQPSVFDFGLMVQTVAKDKDSPAPDHDPRSEHREKIERLPVLEGIRKYADGHVLLVGRPGSGKSTALIRLLLEEASSFTAKPPDALTPSPLRHAQDTASPKVERGEQEKIPVLVELRYWQGSIEGLIQGFLKRHGLMLDDAALSTQLGEGRFLLLVDGLNELPTEEARTQLSAFRRSYPHGPMIFTTRDLGLGGDLGIEKKLEMQPLTEAQMKAFIRAYVPNQAEAMLRQLNHRLRDFGQTPLLLWMLCEVFQQSPNQQLPNNLAEVFRSFTTMYEDSSVRKHEVALLKGDVRPLSDRRLWKPALMALAALMMQGETLVDFRVAIHRTEAERELGKIFAKEKFPVRDILDDLLKYHLLQNRTTDQLEFRHQLIQEYYAAEHLRDLLPELSDEQLKRDYLNLLKWTEPIALMLALVNEEAQALRVVKLAIDDVDLMLGARLAGRVKIPVQAKTIRWIDEQSIPLLLKVKCWAISYSERAVPTLLRNLDHHDPDIRLESAWALGTLGNNAAIPILLQDLKHQSPDIRWRVAWSLGRLGSDMAIPDLLKSLENNDPNVRKSAVDAIGELGSDAAVPGLLKALEHQVPYVRQNAAIALEKLGKSAAVPGLIKALEDLDPTVRSSVIKALEKIGTESAIPALEKALSDSDYVVCWSAVSALERLGVETEIYELLNALKDSSLFVRWKATDALLSLKSDTAITGLLKALEHNDLEIRLSVAWALGKLGNSKAIPELLKALEKNEADVCWRIAEALAELGSELAIPGLLVALESQHSFIRLSAVQALERLGSQTAIPSLLKALEDSESMVSLSAAKSLKKLGVETAIYTFLKAFNDKNSYVRWSAAEALGNWDAEEAFPELLKALKDHHPVVRSKAAEALGKLGDETAINDLLKVLFDQDLSACKSAAIALQNIGSPMTLGKLWKIYRQKADNHLWQTIFVIQNRCKFYNYEIWQETINAQKTTKAPQEPKTSLVSNIFPNATEVKIIEWVEHYYEKPPSSDQ